MNCSYRGEWSCRKEKRLQKDFDKKHRHFLGKRVGKFLHRSRLRRCFRAFQVYHHTSLVVRVDASLLLVGNAWVHHLHYPKICSWEQRFHVLASGSELNQEPWWWRFTLRQQSVIDGLPPFQPYLTGNMDQKPRVQSQCWVEDNCPTFCSQCVDLPNRRRLPARY